MRKVVWLLCCGLSLLILAGGSAAACTLWAAAGRRTVDQATLIAKNRDWSPAQYQELRFTAPAGGFRFLTLQPKDDRTSRDIAGINEKGLVIVTAAASCIPFRQRSKGYRLDGFLDRILSSCTTVDDVMRRQWLFTSPAFYLVADRAKIGLIEVGPQEERLVTMGDNEMLAHTNHYLGANLSAANRKFSLSSRFRLIRINYLLKTGRRPLTLEDFIAFSQDRHDGPDDSIWRAGSSPGEVHTLATWIAYLPKDGAPQLHVTLMNPQGERKTRILTLDAAFWARDPRRP
jgi:isopenicillin-N N-acyltransferase like protein